MNKKRVTLLLILIVTSCTAQLFGIKSYSSCNPPPPVVTIISPTNTTYTTTSVPLNYTVEAEETPDWVGYSLDGVANITLTGNTTLSGLSYAPHSITVYANDTYGEWGKATVHFTVENVPPVVTIISPTNTTYTTTSVPLNYTVEEENPDWVGYSLDGVANVTLTGNTILSGLSYAPHSITVYANDTSGEWGKATVGFTVEEDVKPPVVTIISPTNTTYTTTDVSLEYKVDEKYPDWIGYSLDGVANITLTGNTTLSGLSLGPHTLIVYANDTSGNWGKATIGFTVEEDVTSPEVTIISPTNTTYYTPSVPLTYRVVEDYPDWVGYSLDDAANVTLTGNKTLSGLSYASHSITVYANDTSGNWGKATVGFTVEDDTPPVVTIISPTNTTYTTTSVPLNYSVNEPTSWVGYSLDGVANVTLTGNTTLSGLSADSHSITVYANDTSGYWGKDTVGFTVEDVTPPVVTIISPMNATYNTTEVSLEYTVDEPTSWVGYSLDGAANETLTGNTTLSGLSLGPHTLIVYANDTSGNWGNDTVGFTVAKPDVISPVVDIISPLNETYYTTEVSLEYNVKEEYPDWIGYSLDGVANVTLTGNTTLSGLSLGPHDLTVYANDTSGNWGNDTVGFTVEDVTPPVVTIISPVWKTTYYSSSVSLTYRVVEDYPDWMGYSLDGAANVTLTGNTTLSGLSLGSHDLAFYANDTSGNWGKDTVGFEVEDDTPPVVTIVYPTNKIYYTTDVSLEYKVVEDYPDWVGYSLDGAVNVTLTGDTTLFGLSYAPHSITVYANDTSGNWGKDTVPFTVAKNPPVVTIISPESKTYERYSIPTSLPLTYKVNEPTDWVGYSLDGVKNKTLTGKTTLTNLGLGSHTLTVYANDTYGNMGHSTVSFTVEKKKIIIINRPPNAVFLSDPTDIAGTSMSLSWTENLDSDFGKYVLFYSTSKNVIDQMVTEITDRSDTSYQMTGLSEHTTYYYIVLVYDTGGLSSDSNNVSARTNSPPNAVSLSDPTDITNTSMSLSWTENEDSDFKKYVLFHSTSEGSIGQKVTETTNRSDTSYQMMGLSENTTYYYVVSVYDTGGLSSDSNQASARTNKTIPPDNEPPILTLLSPVNTTYSTSSVELTWLTNEPLRWAGFSLNGGAITTITGNQTISDLEDGPYNLVLNGTDLAGNNGSDTISFTIYTIVPDTEPPEITHTPVTDGIEGYPIEISAVITDESGVSEAELHYRKGGDTDYALLEMPSAGADTYTATIPASSVDDETIEYYILASDGVNEATHPSVAPTTSPHVVDVNLQPDPVALYVPTSGAISTDTVELTWSESYEPDFRKYVIYMSGSEGVLGDVLKEVAERSETSHTVEELEPDKTYYFSVRAYDTGGLHADSNHLEVHTGIRRVVWSTNLFVFLLVFLPLGVGGAYYYIRKKRAGATPGGILP